MDSLAGQAWTNCVHSEIERMFKLLILLEFADWHICCAADMFTAWEDTSAACGR